MDGLDIKVADQLVKNFIEDNTSSDDKTNVWFSDERVSKVRNILDTEGDVGIRNYLAKRALNGKNTLVVVSTKPGSRYSELNYHVDNFSYMTFDLKYWNYTPNAISPFTSLASFGLVKQTTKSGTWPGFV